MIRSHFTPVLLISVLLLWIAGHVAAAEPFGPDPALAPEEVVAIQLESLKHNDDPTPNTGIAQTYALAHPTNKRVTGPLPRFELMIRSPAYRPLLGHSTHQIERVAGNGMIARFRVVVETSNGDAVKYLWEVGRVREGPDEGAWLPEHSRRDLQHLLPPAPSPQTAHIQAASNHIVRRLAKCERDGLTLAPSWPSCEMRRLM